MPINLGRLQQVELREAWLSESGDFTPWLASPENLALLAETIGIELECEAQEKDVGPFRADILCRDTATGEWVLVENQLERTDHGHLGQLLTYAAGLNAVTIVWVAQRFTDEHRAALDWLNEITDDRFNFFGLEVELWRIGESAVAPKFNVVSKPNDWSKTSRAVRNAIEKTGISDTQALQLRYWTALRDYLLERNGPVRPRKPLAQGWTSFSIGRTGFMLCAFVNTQAGNLRAALIINNDSELHIIRKFQEQQAEIEREFGGSLEWDLVEGRNQQGVQVWLHDVEIEDEDDWSRQHQWFADKLERLHRAFFSRVRVIDR